MSRLNDISGWTYLGLILSIVANRMQYSLWLQWKDGPWADSPSYGLAGPPYIVAPMPVTFLPCVLCVASLALVVCGLRASRQRWSIPGIVVTVFALVVNALTFASTLIGYA